MPQSYTAIDLIDYTALPGLAVAGLRLGLTTTARARITRHDNSRKLPARERR